MFAFAHKLAEISWGTLARWNVQRCERSYVLTPSPLFLLFLYPHSVPVHQEAVLSASYFGLGASLCALGDRN